jgi:hypothetical protein
MGKIAVAIWISFTLALCACILRNSPTYGRSLVMPTVPAPEDAWTPHCPTGYRPGTDHGLKSSPGDEEVYRPWCFDDSGKTNGVAPQ